MCTKNGSYCEKGKRSVGGGIRVEKKFGWESQVLGGGGGVVSGRVGGGGGGGGSGWM